MDKLDLNSFEGHTPGPWRVESDKSSRGAQQIQIWTLADGHRQLFSINCTALSAESRAENRKAAELAAAATSILDLAKQQHEQIKTLRGALIPMLAYMEDAATNGRIPADDVDILKARAALKATE